MSTTSRAGRLFKKYLATFVFLVGASLLASAGVELYLSYQESQSALVNRQDEIATSASETIQRFVDDLERQILWAMPPGRADLPVGLSDRVEDYYRLLRQAQPITTVRYVDAGGLEQIKISNLEPTVIGSGEDYSFLPAFLMPRPGRPYYGPVYFRRDTEPYVTVSISEPAGRGVTVAEVNLKYVTDLIAKIHIGNTGRAYIVDDSGRLVAHPDLSMVLRQTNLGELPQVKEALGGPAPAQSALHGRSLDGSHVLTSFVRIPEPNWCLFVEQAPEEALSPLYATLVRTTAILVIALLASVIASFGLARRMTDPIKALQIGAARFGAGALDERIVVNTGDELEELADDFNQMATHLQELYAGLEQRVSERTQELAETMHELELKSRELEIASYHKSEFLASMSHELRTPLNAVIGFSEVLLRRMFGGLNEKQDEYLKDILDSGQHLLSLINDILDLSKIEAGRLEIEVSSFWLPEALQSSVQMLRETATRRAISLEVSVGDDVGEIEADLRRVRQILYNLLSNALKFTPAGGRVIVTARVDDSVAEIAVHDTGIGIPADEQERVFEAFQQVRNSTAQTTEGTGLGLTLVQRLVELHGGRIWLKSAPGEGSTFTFTLPLRQPAGSTMNAGTPDDASNTRPALLAPAS